MSAQDKKIPLNTAIAWTSQYRTTHATQTRAFLVSVQALNSLLAEMGNPTNPDVCVRIYKGIDSSTGEEKLMLVGTELLKDGTYQDLLPSDGTTEISSHSVYDFSHPCPPDCDPNSPLN